MRKPQTVLAMGVLALAILFLTCDENLTDPDDIGLQELRLGTVYQGSIDEVGEVDQFLFKPSRNIYVHFICSEAVASSEFNPDIALYDDETNARLDGDREYGMAVITNHLVQSGKRYRIQVREWSDDKTGAYSLQLREDLDDEKTLLAGAEISGEIEYVGDVDRFNFTPTLGGTFRIVLEERFANSDYNPAVEIYDPTNIIGGSTHIFGSSGTKSCGQLPGLWQCLSTDRCRSPECCGDTASRSAPALFQAG